MVRLRLPQVDLALILPHLLDRGDDVRVGAAAADIAAHEFAHIVIRWPHGSFSSATADMIWPGCAIAALIGVILDETPPAWDADVPGRPSPSIVMISSPSCAAAKARQAVHAPAIDVNRAGAALAVVATLFRPGQMQKFAQTIEQGHARIDGDRAPGRSPRVSC